jgi:allophanate hydrolase subunit 2
MPPYEHLKDESKEVFLNSSYRLSSDPNFVNYQFEGPRLLFKDEVQRDVVFDRSYAQNGEYTSGVIYVMSDGEMMYAGSDFASAKGYKDCIEIARLIIPDVDRVAQLRPEDHIKFKVVTQDDARSIFNYSIGLISETNILSM